MTLEQRLQALIGEYAFNNAALETENEILQSQISIKDARIADLERHVFMLCEAMQKAES